MFHKHILSLLIPLYMCICHVLSEHPCGENPLRRFGSLTRILNDVYPGREINPAMALLRESNPELHRRLQPAVTLLQSEWRLYIDCVTMVDNGYFKRSNPYVLPENREKDDPDTRRTKIAGGSGKDAFSLSKGGHHMSDILKGALNAIEYGLPLLHDTSS